MTESCECRLVLAPARVGKIPLYPTVTTQYHGAQHIRTRPATTCRLHQEQAELVALFDKYTLVHVGYLEASASQPEDRPVLTKLFGLCLAGDSALHARLVDALIDLSAVEAECRGVGTSATLGPDQPVLANVVAETICGIKIQVGWSFFPTAVCL